LAINRINYTHRHQNKRTDGANWRKRLLSPVIS
jgi:hypothetical protein